MGVINVIGGPSISAPSSKIVAENNTLILTISLADNAASGNSDSLQLSVSDGILELGSTTGLTFSQGASGSSTMTFSGPFADLQAAVEDLTYVPNNDFIGNDTLSMMLSDSGDGLSSPKTTVAISVDALPTLTGPSNISVNENSNYTFASGQLPLTDASATGTSNSLTLMVADGKLNLVSTSGLSFANGANGTSAMTVDGTISSLAAALNGLIYTPTANFSGADQLSLYYTDSNDNFRAAWTVDITVNKVNTPAINAPASIQVVEGNSYPFPANSITLTDTAASGSSDSLQISVGHGVVDLGSITGLTFSQGASGSSTMTFSGPFADLQAAVAGLTYVPTSTFTGNDTLAMRLSDSGTTLFANASVAISVVAQPTLTGPASVSTSEYVPYEFAPGALDLTDPSATGTSDTLALSVMHGILQLGTNNGITIITGADPGGFMTAQGSAAALAAALNGLVYTPTGGFVGSDQLTLLYTDTTDNLTASASVAITVTSLTAEQPTVAAPSSVSVTENSSPGFTFSSPSGITIADSQVSGTSDTVSLSVANGSLTLSTTSQLSFTSGANGTSSMSFSGTLTNLNAALNGLVYTPTTGFFGNDALVISVADSGDSLSGGSVVAITVNPLSAPTVNAPLTASLFENTSLGFADNVISVTDPPAVPVAVPETLTLSVTGGKLMLGSTQGLVFDSGANNSSSMTVTGPLAEVNAALDGLIYSPNSGFSGSDTLAISVTDGADNQTGRGSVSLTVIGAPLIIAPPTGAVNENGANVFIAPISLTDANGTNPSESLTLTVSHGVLNFASTTGLSFGATSNNASSITVTGTLSNLNAALNGLTFTPTSRFVGSAILNLSATDAGDSLTGTAAGVPITINPLPAPVIAAPPTANLVEESSFTFAKGSIAITDLVDIGSNSDALSLSVLHGGLTLGSTAGLTFLTGSNGASAITVQGTLANLNAALNGLVYTPTGTYNGGDTLTLSMTDAADVQTGHASVSINVAPSPVPLVFAPASETIGENSLLTFVNGEITLADAAATPTSESLTISVADGTIRLGSTSGLTFVSGANNSPSMKLTGTLASLNAAVSGLQYIPNAGFHGTDSLGLTLVDSADNLSSGLTSVSIVVDAPPAITAPQNVALTENGTYTFSGTLSVIDAAATPTSDSLTLWVQEGTLALGSTSGLTFTTGSNGSSSITVAGTVSNLDAALQGLVYTPNIAYYGSDSLQLTMNDSANLLSGTTIVGIAVNPLVSPSVSAPSLAALVENTSYTFASGAFSLTDPSASGSSDSLSLSVTHGNLTLGSTTGLTIQRGHEWLLVDDGDGNAGQPERRPDAVSTMFREAATAATIRCNSR